MTAPQPYASSPPPKKSNTGRIIAIVALVVVLVCGAGVVITAIAASNAVDSATQIEQEQDRLNREAIGDSPAPSSTKPPTSTSTAKPSSDTVTVTDGTYRVGEDIPPGRYKVTERAEDLCYWSVERGGDIRENNLGGGFPQFTTRKGDDVTVTGCPDFKRIGE